MPPIPIEVSDRLLIHNPVTDKWADGYINIGTQKEIINLSDGASFECRRYKKFILFITGTAPALPATLKVQVQFSDNNTTWYNYMTSPFHDLTSDGAGAISESYSGDCLGNYIRAVITGATATVKAILVT